MITLKRTIATLVLLTGLVVGSASATSIISVGTEITVGGVWAPANWSNPSTPKTYPIGTNLTYGTAGYYDILPNYGVGDVYLPGQTNGNDLGVTGPPAGATSLVSPPAYVSSLTGYVGAYASVPSQNWSTFRAPDGSSLISQGGLSVPLPNAGTTPGGAGYWGNTFTFTLGRGASFRLGIAVDASANGGAYSPDYVSVFNPTTGTVFSGALTRDGGPDMVFFDITGNAGDSFDVAQWQLGASQGPSVMSLITFDTIALAPVITVQPLSGSGVLGKGFNLSVVVSGSNPDYQWYKNGVPLAGQTNANLPVATSLVATNEGTYSCVITNAAGSVTSSNAVLTVYSNLSPGMTNYESAVRAEPSLISYYTFDDRTAKDDFGTNDGTLVGTATYGPSFQVPGSALSLDGSGYDQLGVVPAFDFSSGSGTVELWVQASAATLTNNNYPTIIANGDASGRDWSVHVPPGAGYLLFGPFNYNAQLPAVLDTNWHHLALIFDGGATNLTVVWDGQPLNNWSDGTIGSHPWPGMGSQGFGHPVQLGTWNGLNFGGNLDEVAFYGATLPLSDIQAHYAAAQSGPANVSPTNVVAQVINLNGTNSLILTGSGGSGAGYTVLTTTNLSTTLSNWTVLATGLPFGAGGSVNFTNWINPATPSLFYRIRVP